MLRRPLEATGCLAAFIGRPSGETAAQDVKTVSRASRARGSRSFRLRGSCDRNCERVPARRIRQRWRRISARRTRCFPRQPVSGYHSCTQVGDAAGGIGIHHILGCAALQRFPPPRAWRAYSLCAWPNPTSAARRDLPATASAIASASSASASSWTPSRTAARSWRCRYRLAV